MNIGTKVKELRKQQKMKLSELAEKSGVQIATLSRIEHEKMTGTLESHIRIAKALGVDITTLYSNIVETDRRPDLHTKKSEADVFVHSEKSSYEILTTKVLSKKMMPILLKIEPNGRTNAEQNKPGTEVFAYCLEGQATVSVEGEKFHLNKRHSLYFDGTKEHWFEGAGKATTLILCVKSPVEL